MFGPLDFRARPFIGVQLSGMFESLERVLLIIRDKLGEDDEKT
jgi:hypothetical protein